MTGSSDSRYRVSYRYGHDGERIGKYSVSSSGGSPTETLYFNKMWTWRYNGLQSDRVGQNSKHIYLGDTRILTKIARADGSFTNEESLKQYYYHSDHLGSAQLITNADGQEYERIEYTPYGELWVEKASALSNIDIPYRFTGKEMDEETGLYYYGARYLDPKTSRWLSTDPALGEYIPGAPINDEAKKRNGNLPGMGGVYNTVNLHLYHYAGNNPVKYTDPDGRVTIVGELTVGLLFLSAAGIIALINSEGYKDACNDLANDISIYVETIKDKIFYHKNTSDLPSQGLVSGDVDGAPQVHAGRQGKHVPGHPNDVDEKKSKWKEGSTGVKETQEGWMNGEELPDGSKVWDSGKELGTKGETGVRVHIDEKGVIHGYPVNPDQYLGEK